MSTGPDWDNRALTIPAFLTLAVSRYAERPFLRDDDQRLSYAEFGTCSRVAAAALRERGTKAGDRVVLLLGNSTDGVVLWFACTLIGAVVVPLNERLAPTELERAIVFCAPVLVVGREEHREICRRANVSHVLAIELVAVEPIDAVDSDVRPGDVACFISTSGSTGKPKAVMQTHRTYVLTGQAFAAWIGLGSDDCSMIALPLHHINAQAYSLMGAMAVGSSLVLVPRFSASTFWTDIRRLGVTQFNAVGAMIPILLERPEEARDGDNPVRLCYVALALPQQVHQRFEQRFRLRMMVGYGLSESTFGTVWPLDELPPFGTIGRLRQHPSYPRANRARVVSQEGLEADANEVGELLLQNPAMMAGYYADPVETARVMGDGWLHTGDLVYRRADGMYVFVARSKEIIRHKGENIVPAEVEQVLMQHPGVGEAVVVGTPSPLGEEDVHAFVVVRPGTETSESELLSWCRDFLGAVKVPARIWFRASLPRTDTHRVVRGALRSECND